MADISSSVLPAIFALKVLAFVTYSIDDNSLLSNSFCLSNSSFNPSCAFLLSSVLDVQSIILETKNPTATTIAPIPVEIKTARKTCMATDVPVVAVANVTCAIVCASVEITSASFNAMLVSIVAVDTCVAIV